jgi:aconitase B
MGIVDKQGNGLVAAADQLQEGALAFFRCGGEIPILIGRQILEQRQFQGADIHPRDIEHQ